jgi:hypothetical protein
VPIVISCFLFNLLAIGAHLANIDDADVIRLRHRLLAQYRDPFVAAVYVAETILMAIAAIPMSVIYIR